jgi:hypothetical protein
MSKLPKGQSWRKLKTSALVCGLTLSTALLLGVDIAISNTDSWYASLLYVARFILTVGAAGIVSNRIAPLMFRRVGIKLHPTALFISSVPLVFLILSLTTAIAGLAGILYPGSVLIINVTLAILVASTLPENRLGMLPEKFTIHEIIVLIPLLLISICGLAIFIIFTPAQWDSLTYHLYFPARWLQEGKIFHIPTIFGDPAPAFSPGNSFSFNACVMGLLNSDFLMNCISLCFLWLLIAAVYRTMLHLTEDRLSAIAPAALLATTPMILFKTFSGYSDILALSMLFCATLSLFQFIHHKRFGQALFCAISAGICAGCKTAFLPYALTVLIILGIVMIISKNRKALLASIPAAVIAGGWWYFRNLMLYGNPIFPAEIKFFGITLYPGPYAMDSFDNTNFAMKSISELPMVIIKGLGPISTLLMLTGLIGWIIFIFTRKDKQKTISITAMILIILWTLCFIYINPYNRVTRFLLPAWILCVAGNSAIIHLLKKPALKTALILIPTTFFVIMDIKNMLFIISGMNLAVFVIPLILISVSIVTGFIYMRHRNILFPTTVLLCVAGLLFYGEMLSPKYRIKTMEKSNAGGLKPAFELFNRPNSNLQPMTIAYAGANIPYIFIGNRMKNKVIYCGVSGDQNDNIYNFWKRYGKNVYDRKIPLCRIVTDYKSWLGNLYDSGANALAVVVLHPNERYRYRHTPDNFTVERLWASNNPKIFSRTVKTPITEVYFINREELKKSLH